MTAMTAMSIGDAGEPAPVRPLTAVPDLDVSARPYAPPDRVGSSRRAGRSGGAGMNAAAVMADPAVLPSRIIPPRPPGARHAGARPASPGRPGTRSASASPGPVRLTRRGRIVAGGVAIAAVVAVAFLLSLTLAGGALASSHGAPGAPGAGFRGMRRVVVEPGQTLWSIASAAQPTADPRLVIQQIMTSNSLSGASIYVGEQLWVPSR